MLKEFWICRTEGGFCCFPFQTADRRRTAAEKWRSIAKNRTAILAVGAWFLPSPLLYGGSGNDKIAH